MALFKTAAKVAVASSVHGRVQHRQQTKFAAQQAQAAPMAVAHAPAAPAPAPAAPAGASFNEKMDQLRQLGELRDSGILSEAEFEIKKSMILNS